MNYPNGDPGWSGGFLKRCARVKPLTFWQRIKRWMRLVRKIKFAFIVIVMLLASCTSQRYKFKIEEELEMRTQQDSYKVREHKEIFRDISISDDLDRIYKEIEETKNGK